MTFISHSASDIKKKLQKFDRAIGLNVSQLVDITFEVFNSQEHKKSQAVTVFLKTTRGCAMPTRGQLQLSLPAPSGSSVQPQRSDCSPAPTAPCSPASADAESAPSGPGRLESSFSVEAILARPYPRAPAASGLSVAAYAAQGLWTAPSWTLGPVLPWACRATCLPAYLGVGLHPMCLQSPVLGLRAAHFCVFPGLGVTGLELTHCTGLWDPPAWSTAEDLHDTNQQKRVRTMFNLEQLVELEKMFAKQHNLVGKKRAQLAARLNLTENQVRVWFQNRRVKYQKQQKLKLSAPSAIAASPDELSSSSDTSIQSEDAKSGVYS
ncbi:PREDICTED: homeobox protein notochord [Chrysochloris asiatica]|uniref:Homeobox protein notochord n=1 Tax=Chrysochloris asiatica TaxID=185453 RepID=A0A9B0TKH6_CHRAS|nr:PREDICTED: homeobox protein notochord [Chrysochloris asiatica]